MSAAKKPCSAPHREYILTHVLHHMHILYRTRTVPPPTHTHTHTPGEIHSKHTDLKLCMSACMLAVAKNYFLQPAQTCKGRGRGVSYKQNFLCVPLNYIYRVNYLFSDTMYTRTLVLVHCWTESYENWCGHTLHIV